MAYLSRNHIGTYNYATVGYECEPAQQAAHPVRYEEDLNGLDDTRRLLKYATEANESGSTLTGHNAKPRNKISRHRSKRKGIKSGVSGLTLFIFVAGYLVLGALLAGLYTWSRNHRGLAKNRENWHYIFKYAPTAVLTIFAAFWAQVEYATKQSAPWDAMARGWTPAKHSLLVDYTSIPALKALSRAWQARHYSVILGIMGSLLFKALIVVSTGLLVAQNIGFPTQSSVPSKAFSVPSDFVDTHVDMLPYLNVKRWNDTESAFPLGATRDQAYQPFSVPLSVTLAQPAFSAVVDVFSSSLDCEAAVGSFHDGTGEAVAKSCSSTWSSRSQQLDPGNYLLMQTTSCLSSDAEDRQRFLICAMGIQMRFDPNKLGNFGSAGCGPRCLIFADPMTCLLCTPKYAIQSANLTMEGDRVTSIHPLPSAPSRQIPGLSASQMGVGVFQALGATPPVNFLGYGDAGISLLYGNNAFESLLNQVHEVKNFTELLDVNNLSNASNRTFSQLAAQVARLHYTSLSNTSEIVVQYESLEDRITVHDTTFFIMEAMLGMLTIVAGLLHIVTRTKHWTPTTLLDIANVLARSPMMITKTTRAELSLLLVSTATDGSPPSRQISIQVDAAGDAEDEVDQLTAQQDYRISSKTWTPFAVSFVGSFMTFTMLTVLIAALGGLLALSEKNQGIINVADANSAKHYAWTILPASVLSLVAATLVTQDKIAQALHPYYLMSDRCSRDKVGSLSLPDLRRLLAPQRLYFAIREGHFALIASTLAVITAAFPKIVVSGLFNVNMALVKQSGVEVSVAGWFNATLVNAYEFPIASFPDPLATTRIIYLNESFPQWTYAELALAEISDIDMSKVKLNNSAALQMSLEVPALRAVLNCTTHPYLTTGLGDVTLLSQRYFQVNITWPETCGGFNWTNAVWTYKDDVLSTQWAWDPLTPGVMAYWAWGDDSQSTSCPRAIALFGEIDVHGKASELTILTCNPYVEKLQVQATFEVPSFNLTTARGANLPVRPLEDTTEFFSNDSYFSLMFGSQGTYTNVFDHVLISVNLTTPSPLAASDGFFQALFQGIDAVADPHELLGLANSRKLTDAMEHLYRIIMAQTLNTIQTRRVPATSSAVATVPQLQPGTIEDATVSRLFQSPIATYILIGLLSALFICVVVCYFTFKGRDLLYESPESIAAKARLLAGSHLADLLSSQDDVGSGGVSGSEEVLERLEVRLKWWQDHNSGKRRFGIDIDDVYDEK